MIAVNEPGGSSTLTPSRATTAPSPWPWTLRIVAQGDGWCCSDRLHVRSIDPQGL